MKSSELINQCKNCPSLNCFACPVEAEIEEKLTSEKVLEGVLRDLE